VAILLPPDAWVLKERCWCLLLVRSKGQIERSCFGRGCPAVVVAVAAGAFSFLQACSKAFSLSERGTDVAEATPRRKRVWWNLASTPRVPFFKREVSSNLSIGTFLQDR
jgi:hypothetical protein